MIVNVAGAVYVNSTVAPVYPSATKYAANSDSTVAVLSGEVVNILEPPITIPPESSISISVGGKSNPLVATASQ